MGVARNLGLPTAACTPLKQAGEDHAWALAVRRFDRQPLTDLQVNGHTIFGRLHQEDFCQALGFGAGLKYEHEGGAYCKRCADLGMDRSARPALDINTLLDSLLLDYLLGNCDNHLKNYSLVYDASWQHVRLAPAYDKMCTLFYPRYATNMGIPLSVHLLHQELDQEGLARCMELAGYTLAFAQHRLQRLAGGFDDALARAKAELEDGGCAVPSELSDCIKRCAEFTYNAIG